MSVRTAEPFEPISPSLVRRAWSTLFLSLGLFVALCVGAIVAGIWIYDHATVTQGAEASVISGSEALWRASPDDEWTIFNGDIRVREGDEISTELQTVVWVTLFDGSTLEITEHSLVRFERLRESRFSDSVSQSRIALAHGAVYATLAPVVKTEYGELEVRSNLASATARAQRDIPNGVYPSFVVEVRNGETPGISPFRAAAFRGSLEIAAGRETTLLTGPEQLQLDEEGVASVESTIRSQILANGSFSSGLDAWEPIYTADAREPREQVGMVEAVPQASPSTEVALHIHRPQSSIWALTGVRQRIERTLRLPAALTLEFDVLVEQQGEAVGGRETAPLAIELDYTDILGQERSWTTVYALRAGEGVVDADAFTTVAPGTWTHVIVDLHNLEPIPKILDTIVVYASGGGYDAYIANLSLTAGEGNNLQ